MASTAKQIEAAKELRVSIITAKLVTRTALREGTMQVMLNRIDGLYKAYIACGKPTIPEILKQAHIEGRYEQLIRSSESIEQDYWRHVVVVGKCLELAPKSKSLDDVIDNFNGAIEKLDKCIGALIDFEKDEAELIKMLQR